MKYVLGKSRVINASDVVFMGLQTEKKSRMATRKWLIVFYSESGRILNITVSEQL
jgi:hypothetical protein